MMQKMMLLDYRFGTLFDAKSIKNLCKKSSKNQDPKTSIFDTKNLPKLSQKGIKNASKIDPKNDDEKL